MRQMLSLVDRALLATVTLGVSCALIVLGMSQRNLLYAHTVQATGDRSVFDVVSIRPVKTQSRGRGLIEETMGADFARAILAASQKGRFNTAGLSVHQLIQLAYDVRSFQIEGAPSWVRSERFAIDARSGSATTDQVRAMLRSLLDDRFKLMLHREALVRPVYELIPARSGLRIAPMKQGDCITLDEKAGPVPMDLAKPVFICDGYRRRVLTMPPERSDRIEAGGITMSRLVNILTDDVGRTVVDRTGFTERFNLLLDFAPNQSLGIEVGVSQVPTIFGALEEQLGLRLQRTSGRVNVLVIDAVERPSPN